MGMFEVGTALYTRSDLLFQRYVVVLINGGGEYTGDGSKGGDLCVGFIG